MCARRDTMKTPRENIEKHQEHQIMLGKTSRDFFLGFGQYGNTKKMLVDNEATKKLSRRQ
jgi:hypothetical protein